VMLGSDSRGAPIIPFPVGEHGLSLSDVDARHSAVASSG
jgi:hypothetical protein